MPSMSTRRSVTLAVAIFAVATVALAVVVAVPANAADAGVETPERASESARGSVAAPTETDGNATANVTIRSTVDAEWSDLHDANAVRAAIEDGTLSRADAVAVGDPLVVTIRHPELVDRLARGNATGRFFETFATRRANLTFVQTNPSPERRPSRIHYPRNATRVVADADADLVHVVIDTRRAPVVRDRTDAAPERVDYYDGYEFVARVGLAAESNLTAGDGIEAVSDEFRVVERKARLALDDETSRIVYANPAPDQTVRGETNVRPGLNVTVVARGGGDPRGGDDPTTTADRSFVREETVRVREGPDDAGQFAASFDFADVPANATARLDVRYDGRSILEENASVAVVAPAADLRVREVEPNATWTYARVRADADLSRGGFVVLHRGSADGPVVGASGFLARGARENVTVYVGDRVTESGRLVAVAHRDANYNRWFDGPDRDPAYANGTAVVETDHVLRPETTRRVTLTATPTLATTRTAEAAAGTTGTATTRGTAWTATTSGTAGTAAMSADDPDRSTTRTPTPTTDVPIPGFGVAAAAVALLAAGVRAARRRR